MSSDRTGSVGDATEPGSASAWPDGDVGQGVNDNAEADDPWFAPGPKKTAYAGAASTDEASAASAAADGHDPQAEWFLRTGRAGLHPDSVTPWDDASAEPPQDHHEVRVTAAGAPPWAGESTAVSGDTPPPWETGPWPGPDAQRSRGSGRPAGVRAGGHGGRAATTANLAGSAAPDGLAPDGESSVAVPARWPARTVAVAGLTPLVVPGLVLGFLSLRQAGSEAIRKASWLAIGASTAWAVIIIVIVVSLSGGSAGGCSSYPAGARQAYEKALSDLSGNAPASVQAADLGRAASLANASAATAGQIGVRNALFTMASDMAEARADVVARRPIPSALRQHLAKDGAPPSGSC